MDHVTILPKLWFFGERKWLIGKDTDTGSIAGTVWSMIYGNSVGKGRPIQNNFCFTELRTL